MSRSACTMYTRRRSAAGLINFMSEYSSIHDPAVPRADRIAAVGYDYAAQPKTAIAVCNGCGSDAWTVISHTDRFGFAVQTTACRVCGTACLNPRLTAEGYAEFYRGVYRPLVSAFHGRLIDARTIQDEQREYAAAYADFAAPFLEDKRGAAMLDVGGSTGIVAAHFARRFGLRATIVDPAPDEIAEAQSLGIETVTALIEDWDAGDRKFPVIGMFQTIDHLLDVTGTLAKLRSVIADDGVFLVDVVDFRAAYLRARSVEAATKIDHPFSLVEQSAEAFFARAGFAVARKNYAPDHLHVGYVLRPGEPQPGALPDSAWLARFFEEIRSVHNSA